MTDAEYRACGYSYRLHFVAEHTSGIMAGRTRNDSLCFCRREDAQSWIDGVNRNHKRGTVNYKVTHGEVVKL